MVEGMRHAGSLISLVSSEDMASWFVELDRYH